MSLSLETLSEHAMQELLVIEMVQQLLEQPKSGSPYFIRPKKHLDIALKLLTQNRTVTLVAKSDQELQACIELIKEHAHNLGQDPSSELLVAAKQTTTLEGLVAFAKLYYCSIIRKSIISPPMSINRRTK